MAGVISADDFNLLQEQLIELKRHKYEASEREKKYQNEIKGLKEQVEESTHNKGNKTSFFSDIVNKAKDKGKLNEENEILKKTIEENNIVYKEQNDALKLNIKSLFETNSQLEEQILLLKKDLLQNVVKGEDQQNIIRKLQIEVAELHCSKEELENKVTINNNNNGSLNSSSESNNTTISNSTNSNNVSLESILSLITTTEEQDNENLKTKITELFNSVPTTPPLSTPPSSTLSPKEAIFHPLGEPEINVTSVDQEKQRLLDTIKNLMEQVKDNESITSKFQNEIKQHLSTIEQLNTQCSQFQEKHRNAEINRVKIEEKYDQEIQKLGQEIKNLENEKEQSSKLIQNIENNTLTTSKNFHESISLLEQALEKEKKKFEDKETEIKDMKLDFERQLSDIQDKSNIFKQSRDEYLERFNQISQEVSLRDENLQLKSTEISNLVKQISNLETQLEESKKLLESSQNDIESGLEKQESYVGQMKALQDKLAMERKSFDSLTEQFNVLNLNFTTIEKSNASLEKEKLEHTNQIDSLNALIKANESEFNQLKEKYETADQELSAKIEIEKEQTLKIVDLENQLENLVDLPNQIKEKDESIAALESETKEIKEKLTTLEPNFAKTKADYEESCQKIVELQVALQDAERERKIVEKKNAKMIKDLKVELSRERDSVTQLSQSANNVLTSSTITNSPSMPNLSQTSHSLPTTPSSTPSLPSRHTRSISRDLNLNSPMKTNIPMYPQNNNIIINNNNSNSNNELLKQDLEILGKKLGQLGTERYKLEERVRLLENENVNLNAELEKKTKLTRFYISRTQLGRATNEDEKTKRLKGGASGSFWRSNDPKIVGEIVEKMEIMLQENILKNMQLTDDISLFGSQVSKLENENTYLKTLLSKNGIEQPTFESLHQLMSAENVLVKSIEIKSGDDITTSTGADENLE